MRGEWIEILLVSMEAVLVVRLAPRGASGLKLVEEEAGLAVHCLAPGGASELKCTGRQVQGRLPLVSPHSGRVD